MIQNVSRLYGMKVTNCGQAKHSVVKNNVTWLRVKVNYCCCLDIDQIIKELAKLNKPLKYAVTCFITQNMGRVFLRASTM